MAEVIRFFHIRPGLLTKGGATVKVSGDTDTPGQVDVQLAKCSRKDNYVKAIGRAEAAKAPIKVVPLRYLPQELGRISESVVRGTKDWVDFTYSLKYFLPKE